MQSYASITTRSSLAINVNKRPISMKAPNANMEYGKPGLTAESGQYIEVLDGHLTSDTESIIAATTLVLTSGNYGDKDAGTELGGVSLRLDHPNYKITHTVTGNLSVNGRVITDGENGLVLEVADEDCVYNGKELKPQMRTARFGTVELVYEILSYENNVNAGNQACIKIELGGNYKGVLNAFFTIKKLNIANAYFDPYLTASESYTGSYIVKDLVNPTTSSSYVKTREGGDKDEELISGIANDYTVTTTSNLNAGTAKMTFSGNGKNVEGEVVLQFTINPQTVTTADIGNDYELSPSKNIVYTGSAIKPVVTYLRSASKDVAFEVDSSKYKYKLKDGTEQDAINVGTYVVVATITGAVNSVAHNYQGEVELEFNIIPLDITNDSNYVIGDIEQQTYQIEEVTPQVKLYKVDNSGATPQLIIKMQVLQKQK